MIIASFGEKMMKPQRELQGPRPPPLKISKESYKIKKPEDHQGNINNNKLPRLPVVIHLKSPEIIHVKPQDFMNLVQQLTGNPTTLASSESLSVLPPSSSSSSSLFQSQKKEVNKKEQEQDHVVANHDNQGLGVSPNSNMASINYQYSPMFSSLFLPSPSATATYTSFLDFGPIF